MSTDAYVVWSPYFALTAATFLAVAYHTAKLFLRSRVIRRSPSLLLFYLSLNVNLVCNCVCVPVAFPWLTQTVVCIVGTAGNMASVSMTFIFLARVMHWVRSCGERNAVSAVIDRAFWVLLWILLPAVPAVEVLLSGERILLYYAIVYFTMFACAFVTFVILAQEYRRIRGVGIFIGERMLCGYFASQLAGLLSQSTNLALLLLGIDLWRGRYTAEVIYIYASTLVVGIMPCVLAFRIVSAGLRSQRKNAEAGRLNASLLTCSEGGRGSISESGRKSTTV